MQIKGFKAWRPRDDNAARVASVPYDTVNRDEARALAAGNPDSFLHVVRPDIDLVDDENSPDALMIQARQCFDQFCADGVLWQEPEDCLFVYQQQMGDHVQTGLVACSHVEDYDGEIIKKHEKTRPDKEDDRTRHIQGLSAQTGPVFLTYRDEPAIDKHIAAVMADSPLYDFSAEDGVAHRVWRVASNDALIGAFTDVPLSYIADGHHRAAAASRSAYHRRKTQGAGGEADWFLTVLFPATQLKILSYNRLVKDLTTRSIDDFLAAVKDMFEVTDEANPIPSARCHVSMYLAGRWYGLCWRDTDTDPVSSLDVSVLQDRILGPLLDIDDPRTNQRISFVGGIRGAEALTEAVDAGKAAVAFSLFPVGIEQMMAIADADGIMPPKSTWFEPKLRSGLFVHRI